MDHDKPHAPRDSAATEASLVRNANDGSIDNAPSENLKRELTRSQMNMMALAGSVGTGLIIGTGTALSRGGPLFLLISYLTIGAVVYFVMTCIGEMATFMPMQKGFPGYATRFVDPAFGYVNKSPTQSMNIFALISEL